MELPLKVLIAEDNPNDAELAVEELRRSGFDVKWERVETEVGFLEKLKGGWDLILSDYQMNGFDGFRALELLKLSGLDMPFILISGTIGEDTAVKAMKLGASDYLLKDRLARLGTAVTHALLETRLRRERMQSADSLRIAHAQLGQLLENSPAILYTLKLDGDKVTPHHVSENLTDLLGCTVAEAMSPTWWSEQLHPADRARAVDSIAETLVAGSSLTEYRIRHRDGHYVWVDDARRLIRNEAGQAVELIGVWTDVTERRMAEEVVLEAAVLLGRKRKVHIRIELAVFVTVTALISSIAVFTHLFEGVTRWFLAISFGRMDEVILMPVVVAIGFAIFAFRRWRETKVELTSHQQVQTALGLLHDELDRQVKQRTTELKHVNQALVVEVAEHSQAETGLKESNRRFREMLENVELIAMTLDRDGIVTFCNDYLLALTGWKREEVIGAEWFHKFRPDADAATREKIFSNIKVGIVASHYENSIVTRSGEARDVVWSNTILRDSAGGVTGTASIGEDVTSRNKAARILLESEERFRELAENIHEVFWISDSAENKTIYVSPAFEAIWGRTCASLYGASGTWLSSIRPEDRERIAEAVRTKQPLGTYDEEYRIVRPDGTERWIRDRAYLVRGGSGPVSRCVGVAEDITEAKKMQEQFFRAQRMEAIGTLAGGIAHDLNNILAPIIMAPELLREFARTDQELRLLDLIERSAQRGAHVVRQLLTFSRGSGGERMGVQLRPLLNDMVGIMRETFPREIALKETAPGNLRIVQGDPTQLHQVIMNLCVNARDAMPNGGTLKLEAKNVELSEAEVREHPPAKPGPHVAVSVTDTGEGIAPANLGRIFDPFFTTKAPTKGTGLGLSTVLGIVRSHQGFIAVTSRVGRGTTFTIFLPAEACAVATPDVQAADAPAGGHGELILVVDDEELIRTATRMTLEGHGYRVLTAGDGAEGLASFIENRGDVRLVLTDLMMPVMGGVTLIHAIHVLEPNVRVLATSGLTDQENHTKLIDVGVDGIIPKPCDPCELLKAIALQLATTGEPTAASATPVDALSA